MGTVARSIGIVGILALGFGASAANGSERETQGTCGVGHGISAQRHIVDATLRGAIRGVPPPGCDDGSTIDLMVVYTALAREQAGGTAEIQDHINIAVQDANDALDASEIETTIRLVHTQEVVYAESGQYTTDAPLLINDGDGVLDEVHALRDFYGADCVSLWVRDLNAGGVGFYPHPSLTGIGASGFTIMRQDNYVFHTLAHELGHNFYCAHDRDNTTDIPYAEYSYGYREPAAAWHDIMAYPPGDTIPYFANPNVNWSGPVPPNPGPTGVPQGQTNPCDIARTMNELRFYIANFRPTAVPGLPSVLRVRAAAPEGGDGLTWATAFRDLQEALCKAAGSQGAVQQLWVAAGTYRPDRGSGDRAASFHLLDYLAIYGGFNGVETLLSQRNPAANVTTLSGDIGIFGNDADNSFHVADGTGAGPTAVLDGLAITHGRADGGTDRDDGGAGLIQYPGGNPTVVNCTFTLNTAALYGGAVRNYTDASPTFIDCTFSSNAALGIDWPAGGGAVHNYGGAAPTLAGCTFTGNSGNLGGAVANLFDSSPTFTDSSFQQNQAPGNNREGGAVYNYTRCHPQFADCTFSLNTAERGGGIYAAFDCDPALTRCALSNNTASGVNAGGGALYGYTEVNAALVDCTFTDNTATYGGAVCILFDATPSLLRCTFDSNTANEGGGVYNYSNVSPSVTNCVFSGNEAVHSGAMANYFGCSPTVTGCTFRGNQVTGDGGAIDNYVDSSPALTNCLFSGNSATSGGGMISYFNSNPVVSNCTFSGNSATSGSGGLYHHECAPRIVNCLLWGNTGGFSVEQDQINGFNATTDIDFCSVQGWTNALGGTSNNGSNAEFVDADGVDNVFGTSDDNARLPAGSPAVNSGDNAAVPPGITTDLEGRTRVYAGTVDRGAYEVAPASHDADHDGDVDLADYLQFSECIEGPNTAPTPIPPPTPNECLGAFDDNLDGDVDLADFAAFQGVFAE